MALENVLAELYQDRASIDRIAHEAGIDVTHVAMTARAVDTWHAIIQEAQRQSRMAALAALARSDS